MSAILFPPSLFSRCPVLGSPGYGGNDDSLQPNDYRVSPPGYSSPVSANLRFSDVLWPRASFTGGIDANSPCPYVIEGMHQVWEWNFPATGGHVEKKVIGQTLDSSGAPLAGATVQLFNTATGLLVDTQVSDAGGNYQLSDPNGVACFVVAYEPGSPDVAGTTVNTLTGV
ncbi:carboxypeptidase-like regulatory domain-containing protein [Rhodoblastus sp. 17X3]|uniref:carboxypeptidase-like regulatory domain-containing protein n=1 Tax=Rhodoblastus sp. 17X3 TaxID=3047026 RepID=UPI0024B80BD9|nr:carboxypeptidase-like regulatory domain-containing protein [Rhodoblastus sp. 17X3]MDI9847384.1 carboxypeptidase-like regulatory domain-containing protein [Rhodoblastus sp. 17X3]